MTYILILFAILVDGSQQALGGEFKTLAECEAKMQEVRPSIQKHPAVSKFVLTCQQAEYREPV